MATTILKSYQLAVNTNAVIYAEATFRNMDCITMTQELAKSCIMLFSLTTLARLVEKVMQY